MSTSDSTAKIANHPIHPMLVSFPIAAFVGTLVADIAYLQTRDVFWFTASKYLLGAGLVMAALAAIAGLIDFIGSNRVRSLTAAWIHAFGNVAIVGIELWNLLLRATPEAVPGMGIALSSLAVVVLFVTGWMGWEMVYRQKVAVED